MTVPFATRGFRLCQPRRTPALLVALAVAAVVLAGSVANAATTVTVASSAFPFHSGIQVGAGQSVVVTATGLWDIGGISLLGGPYSANGSTTGYTEPCKLTGSSSPSTPMGALVGTFDLANRAWFRIGTGPTVVTNPGPAPAELLLAGNDNDGCVGSPGNFGDNHGSLTVTVDPGRATTTQAKGTPMMQLEG